MVTSSLITRSGGRSMPGKLNPLFEITDKIFDKCLFIQASWPFRYGSIGVSGVREKSLQQSTQLASLWNCEQTRRNPSTTVAFPEKCHDADATRSARGLESLHRVDMDFTKPVSIIITHIHQHHDRQFCVHSPTLAVDYRWMALK